MPQIIGLRKEIRQYTATDSAKIDQILSVNYQLSHGYNKRLISGSIKNPPHELFPINRQVHSIFIS